MLVPLRAPLWFFPENGRLVYISVCFLLSLLIYSIIYFLARLGASGRQYSRAQILDVAEQSPMMLPSPVTSTPFSVKDILKLEQQSHHQLQVPLPDLQQQQQQRFHTPPSCLLGGAESPGFSDSEDRMAFLNALSVQDNLVESSLSPPMFGHPALGHVVDAKLEDDLEEQETSECFAPENVN